jgi:hypothetical protein
MKIKRQINIKYTSNNSIFIYIFIVDNIVGIVKNFLIGQKTVVKKPYFNA